MYPTAFLRNVLRVLLPVAVASTISLYLYPLLLGCAFPVPAAQETESAAFRSTLRQHVPFLDNPTGKSVAPFRFLALADPQIEGDTSIPNAMKDSAFPHLWSFLSRATFRTEQASLRYRIRDALHDLVDFWWDDVPDTMVSIHKTLDLYGNDYYLGHIYRTLHWWSKPTHVTVLGDLVGSQWISDDEFNRRSWRFWNRAFRGGERVPDHAAAYPPADYELASYLTAEDANAKAWQRRIINIAGNHDIGYAGDMTIHMLDRFEREFGKAAYALRFRLPIKNSTYDATVLEDGSPPKTRLTPELRVVVVNDMNLDQPVLSQELTDRTYDFINSVVVTSDSVDHSGHFTLALTHIPLYKREGICTDAPFFDYHPPEDGGGIREQNQLSYDRSMRFLESVFGLSGDVHAFGGGNGRPGLILNGHDHRGCDTYHYINQTVEEKQFREWQASRWAEAEDERIPGKPHVPGMREITVRSMMGQFGGYAGLLSLWFDEDAWEWKYEYATCSLGSQDIWWTVHVIDLIAIVAVMIYGGLLVASATGVEAERVQWPASVSVPFVSESAESELAMAPARKSVADATSSGRAVR